eukprot:438269_1
MNLLAHPRQHLRANIIRPQRALPPTAFQSLRLRQGDGGFRLEAGQLLAREEVADVVTGVLVRFRWCRRVLLGRRNELPLFRLVGQRREPVSLSHGIGMPALIAIARGSFSKASTTFLRVRPRNVYILI